MKVNILGISQINVQKMRIVRAKIRLGECCTITLSEQFK